MQVKDLNGVVLDIEDGILQGKTIDPRDEEYIEEVLDPEMKKIFNYLILHGIFSLDRLKQLLSEQPK